MEGALDCTQLVICGEIQVDARNFSSKGTDDWLYPHCMHPSADETKEGEPNSRI